MNSITINNLTFSYDGITDVLDNVSLSVKHGEILSIIGPNGSGKSTLIKCISGYKTPASGQILINNKNISSYSTKEIAKTMALIQQHFAMEYNFTVIQMVLMGRNPHIKRMQNETLKDYNIAYASLKRTEIFHLKSRSITTLSGGEWQRMILARALCQQASIMLLDEPVAGLDIKHQINLMSTVSSLAKSDNITTVCVLHDLNLASYYSDTIVLLKQGKIYKSGKPKDVLTKSILEHVYETNIDIFNINGRMYITPQMNK